MCGIAGIVWRNGEPPPEPDWLRDMAAALRHRGPDDEGQYVADQVALVHTRLSIIDLASGGQPLSNEDGTVWIVFNGEIYNFRDLRERLIARGHRFATSSDTEVIVHLYEEDGVECLNQLRGMFAIAIWDAKRRRLLLARDRFGKKPLVFAQRGGRLIFGSEIKALRVVPDAASEIDPKAIDDYLTFGYIPHPRTVYRGVHKLPPAHYALFENGQLAIRRYWTPESQPKILDDDIACCEQVRAALTEATRLRLVSDVPLGAFLSGGIDSGIIVGLMQRLSNRPVKTFSIRFAAFGYDESEQARITADHIGTEHHDFLVQESCIDVLPDLVWHFDEPFADASALPTYYVAKLAKREVTVALTGDGGDEVFCGYARYQKLRAVSRFDVFPSSLRGSLLRHYERSLRQCLPRALRGRAATFLELAALSGSGRLARIANAGFRDNILNDLYEPDFARELDGHEPLDFIHDAHNSCANGDSVANAALVDKLTYLPCDILTKVDIASMANGVECRSPFLDHQVVDLAERLPTHLKLRGATGKYILRRAFRDLLPAQTFTRRKKGFSVPLEHWFRGDLRDYLKQVLLDPVSLGRGYFRPAAVHRLIDEHVSGRANSSVQLWMLLWLEQWHRVFAAPPIAVTSRA